MHDDHVDAVVTDLSGTVLFTHTVHLDKKMMMDMLYTAIDWARACAVENGCCAGGQKLRMVQCTAEGTAGETLRAACARGSQGECTGRGGSLSGGCQGSE